ncbi:KxYKxGKxW signal peptide domain-containing protein [Schleiferilactobacillus harbinensis]|uniref:KxYKxGKxW signal peptide domain-containing protein n=1 Tax=Schleiferilactobacillus harbinensis TaxID=304207 RepID=UPI0011723DED|nr:KxYKxGKxW signal peptide domain-containing protein [Schleiferilactobacillus harbinensis]GEK05848.1 hypothetical protein LHA01_10870 [Schleiferilactobacillus harbinensis]
MERKRHYRMYKSGKHWMTAAVVTMAVGVPLATQMPAVKAADTGNQATVTAVAQQDDSWKANAQALKDALTTGGWSSLKSSGQNTDLGTLVSNATDKATLNTSWNTVVQTISTTTLQKLLGTTDTTAINKFLSTQSSDGSYQGYTNNQVIALFVARSTIGDNQTTPTVSYPSTLNSLIVYLNRAVQVNWQTNKTALQNYLVNNGLTTVPVDANGNTIGATVSAVNDATSLNNAWAKAANVIARDEIRRQLGFPNDTNATYRKQIDEFLQLVSKVSGYTGRSNINVLNDKITNGMPTPTNPTPSFATLVTSLKNYVTDAVKAENPTVQAQVVIRDWANGVIINRTTTVTSGQTIPLYAASHDGLGFDSVKINGVTQSTTNGTLSFSQTFSQNTTYYVDYYFTKSTGYTEEAAQGTVYIKNVNGAALYSNMNMTAQITDRNLKQGTAWASYKKVYDAQGNVVGYNLGGQQYVKASDVQETPIGDVTTQTFNGVVSVINPWTRVYSDSAMTKQINNWTLDAGTRWQVFQKVFIDGKLAGYNLGGQQFIKANAVQESTTPSTPQQQIIPNSGVVSIISPYGARIQ